jgi:transcriptional regulator with XRE-family HTH domain
MPWQYRTPSESEPVNQRKQEACFVLGDNVKRAREEAGMTQLRLAADAGLGIATVSDIERGKITDPQLSTVEALARTLGVPVAALLNTEPAANGAA